jgi:uncharacterized alkaline shock family protein YloU
VEEVAGKVTIAPGVLTTIVRMTALENRGVHKLATHHAPVRGLRSSTASDDGVIATMTPDGVKVELHVIATSDANLLKLGEALQTAVRLAIEHMVGMPVQSVDVHIEGVTLKASDA